MADRYPFHGRFRITGCYLQDWGTWTPKNPHKGLDLVALGDKTIYSPLDGAVEFAGNGGDDFGIYVRIRAADGKKHYLCHMAQTAVSAGNKVKTGDRLGVMGSTGNVTGPHTHYEIRIPKIFGYSLASPAAYLGLPNKQGEYGAASIQPPAIVHIDTPKANQTVKADIVIHGWGIHPKGFTRADIWLDAKQNLGTTGGLTPRADVARIFGAKGYANAGQSGVLFTVPYAKLPKGKHVLGVAGIPADGSTAVWATIPIVVQ